MSSALGHIEGHEECRHEHVRRVDDDPTFEKEAARYESAEETGLARGRCILMRCANFLNKESTTLLIASSSY